MVMTAEAQNVTSWRPGGLVFGLYCNENPNLDELCLRAGFMF